MSSHGLARLAPYTGIAAIVLWILGVVVLETGSDVPTGDTPAGEIAAWLQDDSLAVVLAFWPMVLGAAAFIWFLGSIRDLLYQAEGGTGRVTTIGFAAGVLVAFSWVGQLLPSVSGAWAVELDDRTLTPEAAEALHVAGGGFTFACALFGSAMAAALAIVVLRTAVLPRWHGWLTAAWAIGLAVPFVDWAVLVVGLPLWIVVTTVLLVRVERATATVAEPVAG